MNVDSVGLNGLRVLAVDSDTDTLEMLTFLLVDYGTEVIIAASATEALEIIAQLRPDILLINIFLPDQDGYSLLGKIRKLSAQPKGQIPAIAMTASIGGNEVAQAIEAGFQNFITKPFDFALVSYGDRQPC